jgi:hypothetical protein
LRWPQRAWTTASLSQKVRGRHEVGVEDGHEFARRGLEPRIEGAGLVPGPVGPVMVRNVEPPARLTVDREFRNVTRLVGRVIQHLNLQLLARVVDAAHRIDQPIDDVHLVVDGQLDRHQRQVLVAHFGWRTGLLVLVLHVLVHEKVTVPPVNAEDAEDEEVRN